MGRPNEGSILADRYLLGQRLGGGGMGTVYAATDLRTGGPVAVKLLHPALAEHEGAEARLRREAQIIASLTSPRVVRIIDMARDPGSGVTFLVQEYVAGRTLEAELQARGRLPAGEAVAFGREVAQALVAAHAAGIVHRDLKPSNIMLVDGQVKVLDFGISRSMAPGSTLTATGLYLGTPAYSAPERESGGGDIRADIYALGVILYELLAGRLPFDAPTPLALLRLHTSKPPPPLPADVPVQVQTVVARCLEKDPARRYQTPADLLAALDTVSDQPGGHAPLEAAARQDTRTLGLSTELLLFSGGASPLASAGHGSGLPTATMPAPLVPGRPARPNRRWLAAGGWAGLTLLVAAGLAASLLLDEGGDQSAAPRSTTPAGAATASGSPAATRLDPQELYQALLRTPFNRSQAPAGSTPEPPSAQPVSAEDQRRNVVGHVRIAFREATDLTSSSAAFYIYATNEDARARFDSGYRSATGSLTLTGQFQPTGVPTPATGLTATSNQGGVPIGVSLCILIVDNVEIRASSARAFPSDSGDNQRACAVAKASVAHLRGVQAGE